MGFMQESVVVHCLQAIKARLRERELSYADVAEKLGVSEVTVKRMLNHKDIALSRLLELTALCDLDLSVLMKEASKSGPVVEPITERQDDAFFRFPHLFQFYVSLIESSMQADRVAEKFGLDELSVYLYLRALEDLEMIELLPENRVKLPKVLRTFTSDSRFMRKGAAWVFEQAREELLDPDWKAGANDERDLMLTFMQPEHVAKLMEEIRQVVVRYAKYELDAGRLYNMTGPVHQFVMLHYPMRQMLPQFEVPRIRKGDLKL